MKRLLALLMALVLLTSVACADGLKPRRDAVETPNAPAALSESEADDLPAAPSTREEEPAKEMPDVPAAPEAEASSGLKPRRDAAETTPAEPQPSEQGSSDSKDVSEAKPADEKAEPYDTNASSSIDWWPDAEEETDEFSGLKPRRDEEHHAERHAQDEPDPAADDADARSQTLEGTFTIDENGVELSYAFSVEMIFGAEESALKFSAAPTSGYGMELEGELELPDPMIMMTALYGFGPQRDAPTELLHGTLEARDAFDGATCARYTLTLTGDGILRAEDALRGGRWEMNLIPTEAEMLSVASASWLDDLVALIVRNASALEEGDPLRLSLREVAMPFVRALYSPDSDAAMERLGIDRAQLSQMLLGLASGEVRLAPTEEGLSVAWHSSGSPELSSNKIEGEIGGDGCEFCLYENRGNDYATIGRISAETTDGLRVHAEDYLDGGYFYLDAGMGIFPDTFDASLAFARSAYEPPLLAFFDYEGGEVLDGEEQTLRLRVVEDGHMLTCTLRFACTNAIGSD